MRYSQHIDSPRSMLNPIRQHHTFLDFKDLDSDLFEQISSVDSEDLLADAHQNRTLRDGSEIVGVHCYVVEDDLFIIDVTDRGPFLEIQGQQYFGKPLEELEAILLDFLLSEGYTVGGGYLDLSGSGDDTEKNARGLLYFLIHAHGLAFHPEDRISDSTLADELEPSLIELLDEEVAHAIDLHGIGRIFELTTEIRPDLSPAL